MKTIKYFHIFSLAVITLFLLPNVNSYTDPLVIWSNAKTYSLDDDIQIKAHIYNRFDEETRYTITGYIWQIKEPGRSIPISTREITLNPKEKIMVQLYSGKINQDYNFENGRWKIEVFLYYGDQLISEKTVYFEVSGVPERFEADFKMCSDVECEESSLLWPSYTDLYIKIRANKPYEIERISLTMPDETIIEYEKPEDMVLGLGTYYIKIFIVSEDDERLVLYARFSLYPCFFIRGDANGDGSANMIDAIFILNYLFKDGERPSCLDAADVNDDGKVDIADTVYLFSYLFRNGPTISEPYPVRGRDKTEDDLDFTILHWLD